MVVFFTVIKYSSALYSGFCLWSVLPGSEKLHLEQIKESLSNASSSWTSLSFTSLCSVVLEITKRREMEGYFPHRLHLLQPQVQNFMSWSDRTTRAPGSLLSQGCHSAGYDGPQTVNVKESVHSLHSQFCIISNTLMNFSRAIELGGTTHTHKINHMKWSMWNRNIVNT